MHTRALSKKSENLGIGAIWHRSLDLERGTLLTFFFFSLSLAAKLGPLRQCLLPTTTTHDGGGVGSGRGRRRNGPQGRLPAVCGRYARDQRGTVGDMGCAAEEPEENLRRQVHHFHARAPSALQEAPAILRQRQCRRVNESGTISAVGWCVPSCVVAASARAWCYVRALCCVVCGRCVRVCACVCARACVRVRVRSTSPLPATDVACVVLCAGSVLCCVRPLCACVRVRVYACVCARACAIDEPSACN